MSVYIVLMENGDIHSVHKSKSKAEDVKHSLYKLYENAKVKEFKVE